MPEIHRIFRVSIAALFAVSAVLWSSGQDQSDPTDPVYAYNKAVKEIQQQEWGKGIATVDAVISEHGEGALKRYGPVFGHFYFLKGILLQGKEDAKGAAEAFKTSYENYNNKLLDEMSQEEKASLQRNQFVNASLMQWANSEMKLERYA